MEVWSCWLSRNGTTNRNRRSCFIPQSTKAIIQLGCRCFKVFFFLKVIVVKASTFKVLMICCVLQSGETALHVAARYGNVDVVSYLCSIRANPDLADRVSTCKLLHTHAAKGPTRRPSFYSSAFYVSISRSRRPRCTALRGTDTRQ